MTNLLRQMDRAVAMLPLWLKIFIGLVLAGEFIVITQWDRIASKQPLIPAPKVAVVPQLSEKRFDFPEAPEADKSKSAAIQATLAKRMERVVINEPKVQPNGTIVEKGQVLYLYGIKTLDSKQLCTKASGERWACGLHAYADLRNSIAGKIIICDPKSILPNAVTAVCYLGKTDIAAMLVHDGLAQVADGIQDSALTSAQEFAKSRRLGIWDR